MKKRDSISSITIRNRRCGYGPHRGQARTLLVCWLLIGTAWCAAQTTVFKRYVSNDGSFAFKFPKSWTVDDSQPNRFDLLAPSGEEFMSVLPLPLIRNQSPTAYVRQITGAMRTNNPELRVSLGKADEKGAYFETDFEMGFSRAVGMAILLKTEDHVICIFYRAPADKINRRRGGELLTSVMGSVNWGKDVSASPALLIGQWSNTITGSIAAFNTNENGATGGESYIFMQNGTFRHVHVGFGAVVSGVSTETGDFSVGGNVLTLHVTAEKFQPAGRGRYENITKNEFRTYRWYLEDGQTLVLIDTVYSARESWYKVRGD